MISRGALYRAYGDETRLYEGRVLRDFEAWSGGRIGRLPRHNEGDKKLPEKLLTLLVLILEIIKLLLEHFLGQ